MIAASTPGSAAGAALVAAQRYKAMFDNTWILAVVLAATQAILSWYLHLGQIAIGSVVWTLVLQMMLQLALGTASLRARSVATIRWLAFGSQMLGSAMMAIGWHLFGGLQQPLFPLFIALPLLPGALLLGFWQQQVATLVLLLVLCTGVLLSSDSDAFIQAHYGSGGFIAQLLALRVAHSRTVFANVATSGAYDLALTGAVGFIAVALSTTARALVSLFRQERERLLQLEGELRQQQHFTNLLVRQSPASELLLMPMTGRIVSASQRFCQQFRVEQPTGAFLLDIVGFRYPDVVRRLVSSGGEELQPVKLGGREQLLRLRAEAVGSVESPLTLLYLELDSELCWRGEIDALEEPVFVVDAAGLLCYPNRSACALFGAQAEGRATEELFGCDLPRWWDIAPLETARRLLTHEGRTYLASIRRERVTPSLGDLFFVRLREPVVVPTALAESA